MDAMITENLDFAAVQAKPEAGGERIDLAPLVEEVVQHLAAAPVTLNVKGCGVAVTDAGRVRRILVNLTQNALRYGDDVVVEVDADGDWAIVRVMACGP